MILGNGCDLNEAKYGKRISCTKCGCNLTGFF